MSIQNPEELLNALRRKFNHLQDRVDDLEAENERLRSQLDAVEGEHERVLKQLDDLAEDVQIVDASVPRQQTTRVKNVVAIIDHAYEDGTGGSKGVTLDTGEVTAAIDGSRDTALRLMDDIGGAFRWAGVENPGGPKPKQLRLATKVHDRDDLLEDVTDHYGGGGA